MPYNPRNTKTLVTYLFFLGCLMCLGAVTPALAQNATTTVLTLTGSTYPTNGRITVRVTDTGLVPGLPTGTATVIINTVSQTVNLNQETATTAVGTTQIVSQAGSYTISASYNPTSSHLSSNDPGGVLTIAQATLLITANPVTITYGNSPTFTTNITGYVNNDTAPVLGAAGSQGTTTHNAPTSNNNPTAGSWTITPVVGSLSTTNYAYSVVSGSLTVNKATLTVTANSPGTMVYGTADPSLSATVTGQVNNDGIGGFTGTANVISNATSSIGANRQNVGNWVTTASLGSLSSSDYNFTYVAGSYSVTKASLTVTPNAVPASYGSAPSYSSTITGYVSGDNYGNSIAGSATHSLSAPATFTNSLPDTGTWQIEAGVTGLSSSNYSFVAGVTANLTVTPVTLTVSAATPAPIVYGAPTPTFTPSYSTFVNGDTAVTALTGAPAYTTNASLIASNPTAGSWSSIPAVGTLSANKGNYTFAYTNGSFTVNQAVLVLTANNSSSISYGNDFPQFTTTISGYVNGDTSFTAYTGTPSIGTANATTTNSHPNAGSWTITPAIGTLASSNYRFSPVPGIATVTKVGLTVTANPLSINYGASASFTTTVTGYVNGDSAPGAGASGSIVTNSNATLTNGKPNAGTWVITPSVANVSATNYSYAVAPGTLTVAKVPLTLTATAQTVGYGSAPDLSGTSIASVTVTGLVNSDTGTPALTTNAITTVGSLPDATHVAPWTITVAAGTIPVENYTVTLAPGTLTVNPRAITITALPQTVTYGTAFNPAAGAGTVSVAPGLVSGDSGVPTLSSNATLAIGSGFPNSGTWTITPAAGTISATNYTITPVTGTFQVNKAPLVISAAPASITYGAVAPSFSPTYSSFVPGDTANNIGLTGAATLQDNATTTNSKPNAGSWNISSAVNTIAAPNYTFSASVTNAAFTVLKAPITVTAQPAGPITYGNVFPTFTATLGTFVNGDTDSVVRGVPLFTTNATTTNQNPNFGTWTITPVVNTLAADNYTFTTFATNTFSVTKAPLTVNANSFQAISYGSVAPTFSYNVTGFVNSDTQGVVTGSADLSSNATLTNGNPNVGTHTITPTLGGLASANGNYAFTVFTTGQFTVNKVNLTISATSQSIVYGVAPSNAVTYNFVNSDTIATAFTGGSPTVGNNASTTAGSPNVGNWTITPAFNTLTSNNYTLATATTGSLAVTPALLTVTATPQTITYGASQNLTPDATTVTVTGQVNGDGGVPSLTSSATLTNGNPNAGSWVISPAVGTLTNPANYNVTYNTASLTVTKVPLTVTANSPANLTYGQASPVLSASYSGLVNGDNSSAYAGTPILSTNATVSGTTGFQNAGTWTVTIGAGSLAAANYSITLANGSYSVFKKPLTITANSLSTVVGQTPAYTATITGYVTADTAATSFSGALLYSNNATLSNGLPIVGTWTITPVLGGLTSANYTLTPANGTLRVTAPISNPGGGGGTPLPPSSISLTAAPGSLTFTGPSGSVSPVAQTVEVISTASGTGVTITKGPAAWLTLTQGATTTPTTIAATVNVVGLVAGTYKETITVTSADGTASVAIPVTLIVTVSSNLSITQGASYGKSTAPNTAVAVFGAFSCPKPSVLAATVYGVPATIFAFAASQVNLAIPEISVTGYVPLQITCDGTVVGSGVTPIAAQAPGLFTLNYSGTGGGAILNQDYSVNGPSNGAKSGSFIAVYGTGFGTLNPAGPDGLQRLGSTVTATIGGVNAPVVYAGETPGLTHALQQINVQIPADAPKGISVPIILTINSISTQTGVTLSIQ